MAFIFKITFFLLQFLFSAINLVHSFSFHVKLYVNEEQDYVIKSQINLEPPDLVFFFRITQTLLSRGVNCCVRYPEKWRLTQEYVVKCDVSMLHFFLFLLLSLSRTEIMDASLFKKISFSDLFLYKKASFQIQSRASSYTRLKETVAELLLNY